MARRCGQKWYIAGINAETTPIKQTLVLPMFTKGMKVQVYADAPDLQGTMTEVKVLKGAKLNINIPQNGGLVIIGDDQTALPSK